MEPVLTITENEAADPGTATHRRDWLELIVGYGLILSVAWTRGAWQRGLYAAAILWIVAAVCLRFEGWHRAGLRASGLLRSCWVVLAGLAVAFTAVVVARRVDTLNRPQGTALFVATFWSYAVWSFVQQFLLQAFVLQRLLRIMPQRRWTAIALAAGMFAFVHLPNPLLTTLTLCWGLGACWLFLRYRDLYTLGLTHAILGICLAIVVPGSIDHDMRVGLGYLQYRPQPGQRLGTPDHARSSAAWVMADNPLGTSAGTSQP